VELVSTMIPFPCWITQVGDSPVLHWISKDGRHHVMPSSDADLHQHRRARLAGVILTNEIDDPVIERVARIRAALETAGPPIEHARQQRIDGSPIMEGTW
jgi:hypothetical protein